MQTRERGAGRAVQHDACLQTRHGPGAASDAPAAEAEEAPAEAPAAEATETVAEGGDES